MNYAITSYIPAETLRATVTNFTDDPVSILRFHAEGGNVSLHVPSRVAEATAAAFNAAMQAEATVDTEEAA